MNKTQGIKNFTNVLKNKSKKHSKTSPEPNDGNFIEYSPLDSFSANGTVRYGEEQDVDDL